VHSVGVAFGPRIGRGFRPTDWARWLEAGRLPIVVAHGHAAVAQLARASQRGRRGHRDQSRRGRPGLTDGSRAARSAA
jgi:hypothetical protein